MIEKIWNVLKEIATREETWVYINYEFGPVFTVKILTKIDFLHVLTFFQLFDKCL